MEIILVWFLWTSYDGSHGKTLTQQPAQYPTKAECERVSAVVTQNLAKYHRYDCVESRVLVNKK